MEQNFTSKQSEVIDAYDQFVHQADSRDQVAYMATKFQVDYRLLGYIENLSEKRLLNIGCAFPIDEMLFASRIGEWVGIDLSQETIKVSETVIQKELHPDMQAKIHFEQQDATALTFPDNSFDIGVSFSTFDHIPSHEKRQQAVKELARVVKPGGHVIITVPNRRHILYYARSQSQQKRNLSHYGYEYCFSPEEIKKMMKNSELDIKKFISTWSYRDLNLQLSPIWQRPFLSIAIGLVNGFSYFGHRMGYLGIKQG